VIVWNCGLGFTIAYQCRSYNYKLLFKRAFSQFKRGCIYTRYYGRFLVTEKIGAVAFHQQLPVEARIHPAFHVSQLKMGVGGKPIEAELPTEFAREGY